jgi:Ricin-type beta-trefoil lectin domain-like
MRKWYRIGASIAGVLLAAGSILVEAQPAFADDFPTGNVVLRAGTGKCIEVIPTSGSIFYAGDRLQQRTCDGSPQQQWQLDPLPGGFQDCSWCNAYHIVNRLTGQCVDDMNGGRNDRNPLQQWTCNTSDTMVWEISFGPPWYFVNERSSKCIDVTDGSFDDGARIQQYNCFDYPENVAQEYSVQ